MKQQLEKMKKMPPLPLAQRVTLLKKLAQTIKSNQTKIIHAVSQDFSHRCQQESQMAEIMVCLDEIKHALNHIKQWTQTRTWHANWKFFPSKCAVYPQAKGVVGIMAPWNYPVNLVIEPLVAAIAAGNRVMIKPSEITPKTSETLKHMLSEVFSENEVYVVLGDVKVADAFSRLPLDHILFTGSTQVGKIVMRNASENLTPVTLELGGKSPVLIDDDYPVMKAAKSIVQGKWFNAGQTCIAPDYILVSKPKFKELVDAIKQQVKLCYPDFATNNDYSAVVNLSHLQRLKQLLSGLEDSQVMSLSDQAQNQANQKLPPTLIVNPPTNHPVMEQEIFGPLLPIITTDNLDSAIAFINQRPNPLTLYFYSNNQKHIQKVRTQTRSGSLAINETLVHFAQEGLPFGGIGASGMGSYHGYQGFVAMSHMKSVYYQSRLNFNGIVRAPYTQLKKRILRLMS
ncbi:MAG: coniferyl aldehyde dehydrogenase [Marinicella sp.]|nr:coniferyl aldehyde dehydrogenase [Xanthomonadales bacterium]